MLGSEAVFALALFVALALQTWATLRVRTSRLYKPQEKRAQLRLIWLVPLLGAGLSLAMLAADRDHPPRGDSSVSSDSSS